MAFNFLMRTSLFQAVSFYAFELSAEAVVAEDLGNEFRDLGVVNSVTVCKKLANTVAKTKERYVGVGVVVGIKAVSAAGFGKVQLAALMVGGDDQGG